MQTIYYRHGLVLALGILCTFFPLTAQNLIPNPGFENLIACPSQLGNFESDVPHWNTPTLGTTDYFHNCSGPMGTPENFNGEQPAIEGAGYAGFYGYAPDDYREYLQTRVLSNLVEGEEYELSFWVSLAERSDYALREFGVLFSLEPLDFLTRKTLSKKHWYSIPDNQYHYLEVAYPTYVSDTEEWLEVKTTFIAKGFERHLIIGNFKTNKKTRTTKRKKNASRGAYYYIDHFSLQTTGQGKALTHARPVTPETKTYSLDSTQVFNSLLFEFDTHQLSSSGEEELQNLYDFLSRDSSLILSLSGHTDNMGNPDYNQRLSELRCLEVVAFLREIGLDERRVQWNGFGAREPLFPNTSPELRRRNRRVEFLIKKAKVPAAEH